MLVNARNAITGGGKISAKSYIQDGLVGLYDGIENGGYGTHNMTQSAWTPCVGSGAISNFNTARYTGHSYFQNEAVYWRNVFLPTTGDSKSLVNSYNFTVEFLCERMSYSYTYSLRTESSQVIAINGTIDKAYCYDSVINLGAKSIGDVTLITFTADGSSLKVFQNGIYIGGATIDPTITTSNAFGIMRCNIYRVGEYSRALSSDEIAHNYAIDRKRFGVP